MALRDERAEPDHAHAALQTRASRRDIARLAAVAAGLTGMAPVFAARAAAQGERPPQGGQIVVGRAGDADTLDLQQSVASISWQTFSNIFEPLIAWDMDRQYEGILAESWEISADGLEYTFHLRQGITFHDGTEFNADAVKFTFDRALDPATQAPTLGFISTPELGLERAEVVDPFTVKLILKAPFAPFLSNISLATFGILSPAAVAQHGDDFGRNPVGTGPFTFKEWITGETITLARNPDYQNFHSYDENTGAPYVDELVFRNLPEEQTRTAAFETGEVNIIAVPTHQVAAFEENPDVQLFRAEGTGIEYLEFAMTPPDGAQGAIFKPPFDDMRVRQAVAYAVNAEEIIERVLEGQATRNFGPLPTGNVGYNPDIEQFGYHHDLEMAQQLLDEAGWTAGEDGIREKDGEPLQVLFWTWSGGSEERAAQVIQNQLNQVGFDVTLETMESATFLARLVEPDSPYHLDLSGWGWPEPDLLYLMSTINGAFGYYRPAEYMGLLTEARLVSDFDQRLGLYFDAMQMMLGDAAMVPLWTVKVVTGVRAEVQGFKLGPLPEILDYQDAYIAES